MDWAEFPSFFHRATRCRPFPYQTAFATAPQLPRVVHVPTGAGKTATAILGWLWRRRYHPDPAVREKTPRRLVYCLPTRVLVEQTYRKAVEWLQALNLAGEVRVHLVMGGASDTDWLLHPEREAILVGTQDMLLSAALNRGYGMSRFRWPVAFGLVNSDALWVVDELQLMGAGLGTTVQLDAFRERFGTLGPHHTVWMSATLATAWLETVDHPGIPTESVLRLGPADWEDLDLAARLRAQKRLLRARVPGVRERGYARQLASLVAEVHQPGTLTLVVVNTVRRAQEIHEAIAEALKRRPGPETLLLHSRFRGAERRELECRFREAVPSCGRIVVATQVVEAGLDLSARALFTELAPWPSLVQRFGRCNRRGDLSEGTVYWIDVEAAAASPYEAEELARSRDLLSEREGQSVNPASLPDVELPPPQEDLLRAPDLIGLFDTTPDLSGNDLDVSRFVRDTREADLQVFWREWDGDSPRETEPHPDELCRVPVHGIREYLRKHEGRRAWAWDHLGERWVPIEYENARPGMILLLRARSGGYDPQRGWDPAETRPVPLVARGPEGEMAAPEAVRDDRGSFGGRWVTLSEHTDHMVAELRRVAAALPFLERWESVLLLAARWHDAGKAHFIFQDTMAAAGPPAGREGEVWAKAAGAFRRHARPHFRHELASAILFLQSGLAGSDRPAGAGERTGDWDLDLAAYLIASHHGRVRLAIRSLPGERQPEDPERRFALGVWEGDRVVPAELGGGARVEASAIGSLGLMELGRSAGSPPTWLERTLRLRNAPHLGPFRLAFLEACLRAADARASAREQLPEEVGLRE